MKVRALALLCLFVACRPTSRVSGTVEVTGGSPAGVVVRVAGADSVTLDEGGAFEFETTEAQPTLIASGEGLSPKLQSRKAGADPVLFRFSAVGSLAGSATRGGRPSGNGGVGVAVPGSALATATDDRGAWTLEDVPVGTWLVEAVAQGFDAALSAQVTVARGQTTQVEPLVLQLAGFGFDGAVRGRVARVTSDVHDGVRVLVEGAGRATLTTDGGFFALEGVPEGSYTLALEYDGLVERVPDVVVVRGADGFLVDRNLYRLGDRAIPLMGATRVDTTTAQALTVKGEAAAWFANDAEAAQLHVRWLDSSSGTAHEAGAVVRPGSSGDLLSPSLSPDGGALVWGSGSELMLTTIPDGQTRTVADNFRRPVFYDWVSQAYLALSSPGGLVAYEGWKEGQNTSALQVISLDGGVPVTVLDSSFHLYSARFAGEALVSMTNVGDTRQGRLGWWKDGVERALTTAGSNVLDSPATRLVEVVNWSGGAQLVDLEAGATLHSHSQYAEGRLSTDQAWYAWRTTNETRLLELGTGQEQVVANEGLQISCVERGVVVGRREVTFELVSVAAGVVTSLADGGLLANRRTISCVDGRAYWTETDQSALLEAQLPGGRPVALAEGLKDVDEYTLVVQPAADRVWFAVATFTPDGTTWGTLWTAPRGGGPGLRIATDVAVYPRLVVPSADGAWLAFRARSGLHVVRSDGTGLRRLATDVDGFEWLTPRQLIFTRRPPVAPLRFQRGVYLANVTDAG